MKDWKLDIGYKRMYKRESATCVCLHM